MRSVLGPSCVFVASAALSLACNNNDPVASAGAAEAQTSTSPAGESSSGGPAPTSTGGGELPTGSGGADAGDSSSTSSSTSPSSTSSSSSTSEPVLSTSTTADDTTSSTTADDTTSSTTADDTTTAAVPVCGDGVVDGDENCDEGAANGAPGSCCDAVCAPLDAGVVCRAGSGDECDLDESCDGAAGACPADQVAAAGELCGEVPAAVCMQQGACSGVAGEACGDPVSDPDAVCSVQSGCSAEVLCGNDGQCSCPLAALAGPRKVLIVESSSNLNQDMDVSWKDVLTALGHQATIVPQTTLDNQNFFAATDVLIVSSGLIALPPARVATIQAFVAAGKGVYLQSEYQAIYAGNIAFETIVEGLGATFAWNGVVNNQIGPVTVLGCLSGSDGCLNALAYHWYAQKGTGAGAGFETIVRKGVQDIAFSYCPPAPELGVIVTTTDQDWIRPPILAPDGEHLMANIFNRLARPASCKP